MILSKFVLLSLQATTAFMGNQQVILKDGRTFDFFTSFEKNENPLGAVKATIKAYILSETAAGPEAKVYKLYKTKEGTGMINHPLRNPGLNESS